MQTTESDRLPDTEGKLFSPKEAISEIACKLSVTDSELSEKMSKLRGYQGNVQILGREGILFILPAGLGVYQETPFAYRVNYSGGIEDYTSTYNETTRTMTERSDSRKVEETGWSVPSAPEQAEGWRGKLKRILK